MEAFKRETKGVLHPLLIDRMLAECAENRGDVAAKVWAPYFYRCEDRDDDAFADAESDDEVLV